MAILEVTSTEFRDKQKSFLDLADRGEKVVIKRGNKQAYALIPIDDDDLYFTSGMLERIDHSLQQIAEGKVTKAMDKEELLNYLAAL
jgi:antitoxin (DNA-binding transcriptional repressor) of toxin-antitoxin stability system